MTVVSMVTTAVSTAILSCVSAPQPRQGPSPEVELLEPLTDEQREAIRKWREAGCPDSPEVVALRKKGRGEPLTDQEKVLLVRPGRKPTPGPTVPHEFVEALLEARRRRGER
jgi:hypothetical protein